MFVLYFSLYIRTYIRQCCQQSSRPQLFLQRVAHEQPSTFSLQATEGHLASNSLPGLTSVAKQVTNCHKETCTSQCPVENYRSSAAYCVLDISCFAAVSQFSARLLDAWHRAACLLRWQAICVRWYCPSACCMLPDSVAGIRSINEAGPRLLVLSCHIHGGARV